MKKSWIWAMILVVVIGLIYINRRRLSFFIGGPGGVTEIVECDQARIDEISLANPQMRDSVAAVSTGSGKMFMNIPLIRELGLSHEEILFIMLHENAHMTAGTDNEELVDQIAHEQYMAMGYSLRKSVGALTKVLRFNKEEDFRRANAQLLRAEAYDHGNNN